MAKIGRRSNADKDELYKTISGALRQGVPLDRIAEMVELKPDTVRKHISAIKKQWVEELLSGSAESKAQLIERANNIALIASATQARIKDGSPQAQAAMMKIQLEVIDKVAKILGAYEPVKTELTGPNGGPIQIQTSEHPIDNISGAELASRLRSWAEQLEEDNDGQSDVPSVAAGTSENV
jgi:DNA-binding transcriptional MerR regulator